ncbi:MAG: putative oxidoreductase YgfF [Candidatus Marinimicrobia bacterium]|nr:putative oxidoreductase YgfF [Candidatus Neomarinimicrobiota bacterium]
MIQFDGEVVLVTGGSRGIGRAISRLFTENGARVAIDYRSRTEDAEETLEMITSAGGEAALFQADITSHAAVTDMINQVVEHFGQLNIVVNNAGIWAEGDIKSMSPEHWQETIDVNLTGTFNVCRAAVNHLDGSRGDNIINISSTAGQRGEAAYTHYGASKGGIISFTKGLSTELAEDDIRVNCVAPGWVDTEMAEPAYKDGGLEKIGRNIPLKRVGQPEEIAAAVVFLASSRASYITGEILNVNGGNVLCG